MGKGSEVSCRPIKIFRRRDFVGAEEP